MSALGHKRKSSRGTGMSAVGGKADEIRAKADIVTRLNLSERSRQLLHGARPVVTVPAWRASAERPDFPAGAEGRTEQAPAVFNRARAPAIRTDPRHNRLHSGEVFLMVNKCNAIY